MIFEGGCHCGAVRFQVHANKREALHCNCSVCEKKGLLHLIVLKENFTLLSGKEELTTYTFNTGVAQHTFCRHCGVQAFYTPRSHPDRIDVNARCLDDDAWHEFTIVQFDGVNWEENADALPR